MQFKHLFFLAIICFAAVAIPLVHAQNTYGYTVKGGSANVGGLVLYYNITVTVPTDYTLHLKEFWACVRNTSIATEYFYGGIYDSNDKLVASTEQVAITSDGWYHSLLSGELTSGVYYLAWCGTATSNIWYDTNNNDYRAFYETPATTLPLTATRTVWANNSVSMFITYDLAQESQADWIIFGALFTLSIICLILAWKSSIPILNFIFGVLTLGAGSYYLGTAMVFSGWANLIAIVMAIVCMILGAIKLRSG